MEFMGDLVGMLAFAAIAILAVVWFFVPFAIFGTKARLDDLIDAVEESNKHLGDIKAILTRDSIDKVAPQQDPDIPSIRASR